METNHQQIDHLFRHHSGKMVAVLTRIFGLQHLETVEDAVQDTFIQAAKVWPKNPPDNPEGWLTTAAKNRVLDIFRKIKSEKERDTKIDFGSTAMAIEELFLDSEIEDSQLRMIFTACSPLLDSRDQMAFALKTVSGFSTKEIASALLIKEETIKKRLSRARKTIAEKKLKFEIPTGQNLIERRNKALSVIYLIFNEGFHSTNQNQLIRKDLCAEAARLTNLMARHPFVKHPDGYALHGLICFHSARLDSKLNVRGEAVSLKDQDRSTWDKELICLGHASMFEAVKSDEFSTYHFEAAIASEHVNASSFETTNWKSILQWYQRLQEVRPSAMNQMSMATVYLQLKDFESAIDLLNQIEPSTLEQRTYLFHGLKAECFYLKGEKEASLTELELAISKTSNENEKYYLMKKLDKFSSSKS